MSADAKGRAEKLADQIDQANAARSPAVSVTRLTVPNVDLPATARALSNWYQSRKLESQVITDAGTVTIQARTPKWKAALGMKVEITVLLKRDGRELAIEIGRAKWMDKGVAGAAGFVFYPLWITAAVGAYQQNRLRKETVDFIAATVSEALGAQEETRRRPPAQPPMTPRRTTTSSAAVVDLNTASAAEIAQVPGLDRLMAGRIVQARQEHGAFRDPVDLADRCSVPPHVLARITPTITFGKSPQPPPERVRGRRTID